MADAAIAEDGLGAAAPTGWKARLMPAGLSSQAKRTLLRQRLFAGLGIAIVAALAAWGLWWLLVGSHYVTTDDAYVDASTAQITSQVDGIIASVPVHDTDHVKRGEVLAVIDPADASFALAHAEADYAQATHRVEQYFANVAAAEAQVKVRQADLEHASIDFARRQSIASTGAVSGDELASARNTLDAAKANLDAAKRQLVAQQALVGGTDLYHNPEVLAAKSQRDIARLALERTIIRAPFDGIIAQHQVQIGQHASVGMALMTVVPINRAYVNANFKESQLTHVRIGQPVTLTSDLYGSSVDFHGRVAGIGGGTGAAFSVIPAQNATGNWIKVVQRLPVRVELDPAEMAQHPLRIGLSMNATIDVSKSDVR